MNAKIVSAIRNRNLIELNYGTHPGPRIVEPYVYGVNVQGNELLRAYQVDGVSESNEPVHWKLFRVDRISTLSGLPEQFEGLREGYNPSDPAIDGEVFAQV